MTVQKNDVQNANQMTMQASQSEVLPYDSKLQWLQGDGSAYIQTEIYGSEDLDFEVEYIPYSPEKSRNEMTVFGSRSEWNANPYQLSEYKESAPYEGHFAFNTMTHRNAPSLKMTRDVVCRISKQGAVVTAADGSTYSLASYYSKFSTPSPLAIFCLMQRNSPMEKTKGKICSLKFSKDSQLLADFIPVRFMNENKISEGALYDKVSKQLFRNAGTGKFVLGPETQRSLT